MFDSKSPFKSLTINSALIGFAVQVLALLGIQVAPEAAAAIGASISSLISAVAFLVAIWGRYRATRTISVPTRDTVSCSTLAVAAVFMLAVLLSGCDGRAPLGGASTNSRGYGGSR